MDDRRSGITQEKSVDSATQDSINSESEQASPAKNAKLDTQEQHPADTEQDPNLQGRIDEIYEKRQRQGLDAQDAPLPKSGLREDVIGTASDVDYDIYERRKRELLRDGPLPPPRDPFYMRDPLLLPRDPLRDPLYPPREPFLRPRSPTSMKQSFFLSRIIFDVKAKI